MTKRIGQPARQATRTARLVSLVVPLVLAALLLTPKLAHAATIGPGGASGATAAAAEPGEPAEGEGEPVEEVVNEECGAHATEGEAPAEGVEEVEEVSGEEAAAAEAGGTPQGCEAGSAPPASCLLLSARARVFVDARRDRLRLLIDYASSASTRVTVEYRLEGRRGSLKLGQAKRRLARKGVLRLSEKPSAAEMARARAARDFTVTMRIPATPASCSRYDTRRLTVKRTTRSKTVWSQRR